MEWLQAYKIGKTMLQHGSKVEDAYYENYKTIRNKDGIEKIPCIINIAVNTEMETISVEKLAFHAEKSIKEYNYFTSIRGNFSSYYLCNSYLKYTSILDFFGISDRKSLPDYDKKGKPCGFIKTVTEISKSRGKDYSNSSFLSIRSKIKENEIICKKLDTIINGLSFIIEQAKKIEKWEDLNLFSEQEKKNFKEFTKLSFFPKNSSKGTDEVVFVTVSIDEVILSKDKDYSHFCIDRLLDTGNLDLTKVRQLKGYFDNDKTAFEISFPRDSLNLLKSSTGSPTNLPNLIGTGFLLSENSYNALKLGAKKIDTDLKIKIAGIQHYLIPEHTGDLEKFNRFKSDLKDRLELAFSIEEHEKTRVSISRLANHQVNAILLLGFIKGKGDIDFINSIRIPSAKYFDELMGKFEQAKKFSELKINFSFQQIYYLFPVASDKSKKPDALVFYKSLFEQTPYEVDTLMSVYSNLIRLYRYGRSYDNGGKKYYGGTINIQYTEKPDYHVKISKATLRFQVIINLLSNLIQKNNTNAMDYSILPSKIKNVFEQCNYKEDKAALFYLGKLIRLAADAQAKKQKNKRRPILDKINYGGMKLADLKWLFAETIEKLLQYEVFRYAEEELKMFERYFNIAEQNWNLSDIENVFYLFSGYALHWEVKENIPEKLKKMLPQEAEDNVDATNPEDNSDETQEDDEE